MHGELSLYLHVSACLESLARISICWSVSRSESVSVELREYMLLLAFIESSAYIDFYVLVLTAQSVSACVFTC
jgi:hypothetical protein